MATAQNMDMRQLRAEPISLSSAASESQSCRPPCPTPTPTPTPDADSDTDADADTDADSDAHAAADSVAVWPNMCRSKSGTGTRMNATSDKRKGMWPITVVIMSMADFDAKTVDPNSLTFGATGSEKSLFRCRKEGKDMNRDGRIDAVCYFKPDVANFQTGDLNGVLKGKTKSGQQIEGSAALKIFSVPYAETRLQAPSPTPPQRW